MFTVVGVVVANVWSLFFRFMNVTTVCFGLVVP